MCARICSVHVYGYVYDRMHVSEYGHMSVVCYTYGHDDGYVYVYVYVCVCVRVYVYVYGSGYDNSYMVAPVYVFFFFYG